MHAALALLALALPWDEARLAPGERREVPLGQARAGESYRVQASIVGVPGGRARVSWKDERGERPIKALHAGDPDLFVARRPDRDGPAWLVVEADARTGPVAVRVDHARQLVDPPDRPAIESEPNDSWREAGPMTLGRAVFGTADDVDYLENPDEGRAGVDWFRFEVGDGPPVLAYFHLELLDRDVSANLRVHRLDPSTGEARPFEAGKDPMEVVHDRERERYSTHLSRTLAKGTYFVEVNANHPDYVLRSRAFPVPPMADPSTAVEAGLAYLLQAGDAWFAQVPREGNAFVRSANLHETATRCTACHASSYPTEASLLAHESGYPIQSRASMLYLADRLANSPTPLYGGDGLYWQRFIAIPLQAQGKQGGILADFDRQVLGRDSPEAERFGPFLKAAWLARRSFPADESNGVVPLDSKFGLAWRDWRVLTEMTRRTGQVRYAQAADSIADLLADPATDRLVETFQDRVHRLHAWGVVDRDHFAPRIRAEAEALLALQNEDGGWNELGRRPAPSADYATGQVAWTLLRLGYSRDDPRIARALAYLLARQQPFGGWFQSTTHENFRTPMRETRYAVEALAEAYPRPGGPLKGWGGRPGDVPRTGPMAATLEDLEALWDLPEAARPAVLPAVVRLLGDPEPVVRARAAACLGRVGDASAVGPLVGLLGDPSKVAWRSAAWALRRLGNRGIGVEAIGEALESPDPATRRGAARVLAYQFPGMDGRVDLADGLIRRTADPDLWTRLQALRSLRQWFYRTPDDALRRRIVDAYLARMAVPDEPVVRKALTEGMYVLLDENLGGGVSLQKNLAALPEKYRRKALDGREAVERDVLLGPIFDGLESGNALLREALVRSFDGSSFRGRTYAREPSGMLDVGNDREFGFLHEPPAGRLDRAFAPLLAAGLDPATRRDSIRLARFFRVPSRTESPAIRSDLIRGMADPDPGVAGAARDAVADGLSLRGSESDPALVSLARAALLGDEAGRAAMARALARASSFLARPEILGALRDRLALGDGLAILPVLGHPAFSDLDVLAAIRRAWPRSGRPEDRRELLAALLARTALVDAASLLPGVVELIRLAAADPSAAVRERVLEAAGSLPRFRSGRAWDALALAALADESPGIRRQALMMALPRGEFWARVDARERLLALLVDPDRRARELALDVVERHRLAQGSPAVARRVMSSSLRPGLEARAPAVLEAQGVDPRSVDPDLPARPPRLPGLARFRAEVAPLFDRPGPDGASCASCHANHAVLRIPEVGPGGPLDGDRLMVAYASALRLVNLGDPEASLLLRKPSSPAGQGAPDPSSPTGLTHAGGPRWDGPDHPAYRTILGWIREASIEARPGDGSTLHATADGHAPGLGPELAVDGDPATAWSTESVGANPGYPHDLTLDLVAPRVVGGLLYVPRQDSPRGRVRDFEVWLSPDGSTWSGPVARGTWPDDPAFRLVALPAGPPARFVRLRGLSAVDGQPGMAVAELAVDAPPPSKPPEPPR